MSIIAAHTRHVTIGTPPLAACWKDGGTSLGPIGDNVTGTAPENIYQNKYVALKITTIKTAATTTEN